MLEVAADFLNVVFAAAPDNTVIAVWLNHNHRPQFFPVRRLGDAAVHTVDGVQARPPRGVTC
jgi:hypothetical protein